MSYRHRGIGEDRPVAISTEDGADPPTIADKTPPYTRQTLSLMGVAALPWIPVAAGAWAGERVLTSKNGKLWGAVAGFAVSFFTIRHFTKKVAGAIT